MKPFLSYANLFSKKPLGPILLGVKLVSSAACNFATPLLLSKSLYGVEEERLERKKKKQQQQMLRR